MKNILYAKIALNTHCIIAILYCFGVGCNGRSTKEPDLTTFRLKNIAHGTYFKGKLKLKFTC